MHASIAPAPHYPLYSLIRAPLVYVLVDLVYKHKIAPDPRATGLRGQFLPTDHHEPLWPT